METFAHFEIFDQHGNRAAEGHKVRRPCLAVLNFFSIMFPKNDNKVPKQDILGLVLCTCAEYKLETWQRSTADVSWGAVAHTA